MDKNQGSPGAEPAGNMLAKVNQFLQLLHAPQKDRTPDNEFALFPFHHKSRETFDYFAPSSQFTRGLPLRYMNPGQRQAAMDLLQASMSESGFQKVQRVFLLEDVLREREKANPVFIRDAQAYYVTIFGTPGPDGLLPAGSSWSWRIQGHHLSLQWTLAGGRLVSSTPQFIGAQPAEVKGSDATYDGLPAGTRNLSGEEDLARTLIEGLSDVQKEIARSQVPWDLETTNVRHAAYERKSHRLEDDRNGIRGILFSNLEAGQQAGLQELVREHARMQHPSVVAERLERIERAGWNRVRFFFIGGFQRGDALYYKVRGDTFLIEYINKAFSLPNVAADHQHAVWRDFANDWGADSLAAAG